MLPEFRVSRLCYRHKQGTQTLYEGAVFLFTLPLPQETRKIWKSKCQHTCKVKRHTSNITNICLKITQILNWIRCPWPVYTGHIFIAFSWSCWPIHRALLGTKPGTKTTDFIVGAQTPWADSVLKPLCSFDDSLETYILPSVPVHRIPLRPPTCREERGMQLSTPRQWKKARVAQGFLAELTQAIV